MAQTLYDKYGGFPAISGIVTDFYDRLLKSKSLESYFAHVDMERLMDHQTKFLCMVLGGPNNYTGRALDAAHQRLNITPEAFGEVAGHLKVALEKAGVHSDDVSTILGVVAGTQGQVVKQH
jgi:hemoglobin